MSRSRPASNPVSYHKPTRQYYVTRAGRRIYLGPDKGLAIKRFHEMGLGRGEQGGSRPHDLSLKQLANRFLAAQRANWRSPKTTFKGYRDWLRRFLVDHPRLKAAAFSVEQFAAWKLSLRERGYSTESINHYLTAVRTLFRFAEDADLIEKAPKLRRIRNEPREGVTRKPLYSPAEVQSLLSAADDRLKAMILLALNCGFGPKDIHDLNWDHIEGERITLPRSKTGISQTYCLWPETRALLDCLQAQQGKQPRGSNGHPEDGSGSHVFLTRFGRPWNKDAVAEQFRRLCRKAGVTCYGFYRLRHCASTAMAQVASPHTQRRFMRHSRLQQQVTYTHTPDAEVDVAIMKAREELLGTADSTPNRGSGLPLA